MAPPQSETARKLFRALGRDDAGAGQQGCAAAMVVVRGASPAAGGYDSYMQAYSKYLQAVAAANHAVAAANNNAQFK